MWATSSHRGSPNQHGPLRRRVVRMLDVLRCSGCAGVTGASCGRLYPTEVLPHSMGICGGGPVRCWMHCGAMALHRPAERCVGGFCPQKLFNTAWAFATAGQADAGCMAVEWLCTGQWSGVWATVAHLTSPTQHGHFAVAGRSDALLFEGSARIGRAVCGRLQLTGPRRYGMGICVCGSAGRVAV